MNMNLFKTLLITLPVFLFSVSGQGPEFLPLAWDPVQPGTVDAFVLLGTNDLSAPILVNVMITNGGTVYPGVIPNWPTLAAIPGTNNSTQYLMVPQNFFLTLLASNVWGYSSNSNVIALPPPGSATGFRVMGPAHL